MNKYAACPYCNQDLLIDDCIDNDYDGDENISHWLGHCPKCEKQFRWKEFYIFDRFEDLTEKR